jgi:hypothetical protein
MASPLPSRKQAVDLGSAEPRVSKIRKDSPPRVSKIRRDPPPVVKQLELRDPKDVERRDAIIGVLAFALAIVVIIVAVASYNGWSPAQYSINIKDP